MSSGRPNRPIGSVSIHSARAVSGFGVSRSTCANMGVSITPGQSPKSLIGLVVAPEPLEGREVRFLPRQGAPTRTTIDELGNFAVADLAQGQYSVEIELANGVLVIEELPVG